MPLRPPAFHPFNPLLALRLSSLPLPEEQRRTLIDALFRAVWAQSRHVSEAPVVEALLEEAGLPGRELVARAQQAESKARLRRQTDDAIARGIFGVPSAVADGELFFGYDDLPHLERFLAGRDPLDPQAARAWEGRPRASAARRRVREPGPG